jgi:SsrA-binding protein
MARRAPTPSDARSRVIATNRRARRDYDVLETLECGLALKGSEVKSLREAKVQLREAYARVIDGELWLLGMHVTPYSHSGGFDHPDPERRRKLLAHRAEIERLASRVDQEHLSLIPLSLYWSNGRAKVELALARGRKQYDKRQVIAQRDADLEARKAMARGMRRGG